MCSMRARGAFCASGLSCRCSDVLVVSVRVESILVCVELASVIEDGG